MSLRAENTIPIPVDTSLFNKDRARQASTILPIRYVGQHPYRYLCWAACGEMVLQATANPRRMCQLAELNCGAQCCKRPYNSACDLTAWPHRLYEKIGFPFRRADFVADYQSVHAEIVQHGRPLQIIVTFGRAAHTALIAGILPGRQVLLLDPLFGEVRMSYDSVRRNYGPRGGGRWRSTYHRLGASG